MHGVSYAVVEDALFSVSSLGLRMEDGVVCIYLMDSTRGFLYTIHNTCYHCGVMVDKWATHGLS